MEIVLAQTESVLGAFKDSLDKHRIYICIAEDGKEATSE